MFTVLKFLGRIGLALTLLPSTLYFFDKLELDGVKVYMTIGMVVWFAASIAASRMKSVESE